MPILAPETSIYPERLLDESAHPSDEQKWWAIHTKPRQEKSLARDLLQQEIPFYLPLVAKNHLVRGRKVQSRIPLFTSYVFLFGSGDQRVESLKTNRIAYTLEVTDGEQLRKDLCQVQQLIELGAPLTVEARLTPGRRVRIRGGSMAGLEGTILVRRRHTRLVVAVDFLQQGISVEIDDFLVEPID